MRVVAIVVLSTAVLSVAPRSKAGRAMFVIGAVTAAAMLVLIDGPVARAIATIIGVPSLSSVALLADLAFSRAFDRPLFAGDERRTLLWTMAVASIVLYPSALGFITADVYRLGFDTVAPWAVAAAGIALAIRGQLRLATFAFVVLVALDIHLLPSVNVFDYVVDPLGGLVALVWACIWIGKSALAAVSSFRHVA